MAPGGTGPKPAREPGAGIIAVATTRHRGNLSLNLMKTFVIVLLLAGFGWFGARAQVTVDIHSEQNEFLPGEAIPLAIKITNLSGQQLHFGGDPGWLTFSVESTDGISVVKNSEVPVPARRMNGQSLA